MAAAKGSIRGLTKHAKKVMNNLVGSWKIFRGDKVMVTAGKDKGEVGTVSKVYRKENRMIIQGLNLVRRHPPCLCRRGDRNVVSG